MPVVSNKRDGDGGVNEDIDVVGEPDIEILFDNTLIIEVDWVGDDESFELYCLLITFFINTGPPPYIW